MYVVVEFSEILGMSGSNLKRGKIQLAQNVSSRASNLVAYAASYYRMRLRSSQHSVTNNSMGRVVA
jgi:hypothetical protein